MVSLQFDVGEIFFVRKDSVIIFALFFFIKGKYFRA